MRETRKKPANPYNWAIVRWMLIMRPAIVTATLGVAIMFFSFDQISLKIVVIGTYVLTGLYWLAHQFSKLSRTLLGIQIAFDIFLITVIIHYTGGHTSPFVGFYFLSVMCASLFFRRVVTFVFATQAVIFYLIGSNLGYGFPREIREIIILQNILYSILIYAVGFLSSFHAARLRGKDTALGNALKLLKETRLDTSDILQSMTNGLITVDNNGLIMYINRVALNTLQLDHTSTVGEHYNVVFAGRARELVDVFDQQMKKPEETEREIEIYTREGNPIPIGLTVVPLYSTDHSKRGAIVNFKDLTERYKLQEMIRQSERMAAIGELSAAIAHEIRNPLASIGNAADILSDTIGQSNPTVKRLIEVIEKESDRLARISSDFLGFARIRNPEIKPINLSEVIKEAVSVVSNDPRKGEIEIFNEIGNGQVVLFDSDQLQQLLLNVIINSIEALDSKGKIFLKTDNSQKNIKSYIRLIITDNGPGFPKESLGRMFEPFYSTKKNGTGLGLALVRKMTVSNRGRVFARNNQSGGAEVILDLPRNME